MAPRQGWGRARGRPIAPGWYFAQLLGMILGMASVLGGCGPTAMVAAGVYLAADQQHLAVLSWSQGPPDTVIAGTWRTWVALASPGAAVSSMQVPMQVQGSGQTLSLTVGASLFQVQLHAGTLQMRETGMVGSMYRARTWVAVPAQQVPLISTAFARWSQVQVELARLQALLAHPEPDADRYRYATQVQTAQVTVTREQQEEQALAGMQTVCGSGRLALFQAQYPPDASTFALAPTDRSSQGPQANARAATGASSLAWQVQVVQRAWKQAQAAPMPSLPQAQRAWVVFPTTAQRAITQGQQQLQQLQQALTTDYQTMATLRHQSQTLVQQVARRAQRC